MYVLIADVKNYGKHADIILERSLRLLLGNGASLEAFVAQKTSNLVVGFYGPKTLTLLRVLEVSNLATGTFVYKA